MILIDTHALIWALYEPDKLSEAARRAIAENDCCVSIASLWEMSIKASLGKLVLQETILNIAERCSDMGVEILGITPEHCQRLQGLPFYHQDPFDRIIIAQAIVEGFTLVTKDEKIRNGYDEVIKIW